MLLLSLPNVLIIVSTATSDLALLIENPSLVDCLINIDIYDVFLLHLYMEGCMRPRTVVEANTFRV